ncbi:hypothetical protein QQ020_35050 [Fulvivirgaceae bacterium BMA12]|uniref:Uncharacterized protein n=1 Tax=Agaribacillus aureus TaxID=3051825 RepID=A0ABT8LHQ8_9BACT|nr:hypothetical protein [Fulvivirgaceae bacterium BMA12]
MENRKPEKRTKIMNSKEEITALFVKFIDQTINKEEMTLFNRYLKQSGTDPEILRLLSEAWDYVILTNDFTQQNFDISDLNHLDKKKNLLEELIKINKEQQQELAQVIKKITHSKQDPDLIAGRKKRRWLRWLKVFF